MINDKLLNGKKFSDEIINELKIKCKNIKENNIKPKLVVILVGEDFASKIYIKHKILTCKKIGFLSEVITLNEKTNYETVLDTIQKCNNDKNIHGILLQIPLPKHLLKFQENLLQAIAIEKDVDCFNYLNFGKVSKNSNPLVYPCTPYGIIKLLEKYNINVKSKNVTLIGFSNIVNKPLGLMLEAKGATISVCNIFTKNIQYYTQNADIIATATGKMNIITSDMVKENVIIIDSGIIRDSNNKIRGDIEYKKFLNKCLYVTPVPNGVGPVTIAMLMENLWKLYLYNIKIQ